MGGIVFFGKVKLCSKFALWYNNGMKNNSIFWDIYAKLYADLKLFNEKLQFEVEKATQDLRITNSQLNLRNKDLGALQKITNLITRTLDLASITQTIADSISTELGYIGGIIYFYDKEKKVILSKYRL